MQTEKKTYFTKGNIEVLRTQAYLDQEHIIEAIGSQLDLKKGGVFASNYEYPGRYSRWEIAFVDPCLELRFFESKFVVQSLNGRGDILFDTVIACIATVSGVEIIEQTESYLVGRIHKSDGFFSEEERSKQNSIFLVIRQLIDLFYSQEDDKLGLYGAFGYDLVFQFESEIQFNKERPQGQENLVLFLPDQLYIKDRQMGKQYKITYDFVTDSGTTVGLSHDERTNGLCPIESEPIENITSPKGAYAEIVKRALGSFKCGDLFEVVPSHILSQKIDLTPYEVFLNTIRINPSPYNFYLNLGKESLVGSSPEMFVRVEGSKIETCPISGTIKRGRNALEDADQVRTLLNSTKDENELTMCTDVDRNDKSRICVPGSVDVIGRRQIEFYSHLIHTVDHVVGELMPGFDAIDAFLTHMWAVTITGAPKRAAIEWIENEEKTPRAWYGGAVGFMLFNGDMNTGLTLRTIRLKDQIAQIRVGATLLIDSNPQDEEEETYTKASALLKSIVKFDPSDQIEMKFNHYFGKKVLIVDHEDSFVHTLGNYMKQLGAEVITLRHHHARKVLKENARYDVVVLSPGPGRPEQFFLNDTIDICIQNETPIFGVCLGLQGIVEYFGGELDILDTPRHGKKFKVNLSEPNFSKGMESQIDVGLYHSIYAKRVPDTLRVFALDDENIVMGVRHKTLPISAVQFHPESLLTSSNSNGLRLIDNIFQDLGL
ncbi:anthranilate synthase component I [Fusibacter sp. 3D3]|uniref:anthranilate synthase component I n=1 Tax=Fusibacter sp. 3D3 TaxID=1048380 RepID=UPI0008529BE4|nr:anthranilate synthase component I [Fusibacter sp. 3D3]GAU79485.1 anthranilate synthase, aminase component [Fusibacter sp. 3D3]